MELKEYKIGKGWWLSCKCDLCDNIYEQRKVVEHRRYLGKVINNRNLCLYCSKLEMANFIGNVGKKTLTGFTSEQKSKYCSDAGKCAAKSLNSGRFTTDRWNGLSEDEKLLQVTRANRGLITKCEDPQYKANHFKKVFNQLSIGYISKAHQEMHNEIFNLGYTMHYNISNMQVDECNETLKIVIEYNGDFWHCNPETWKPNDYNTGIKMFAKEKWNLDLRRRKQLNSLGYNVIVIWETDWTRDKSKCVEYIKRKTYEITQKRENQ